MSIMRPPQPDDELIGAQEVRRLLGNVSHMWLQRRLDRSSPQYDPEFPRPIQYQALGVRRWTRAEIIAFRERRRDNLHIARRQQASLATEAR
jgi:hypothetical protein